MKFIAAFLLGLLLLPVPARAETESAYDRVMRTGEIRCGYYVWPPLFSKNPNTGDFSGIVYDYFEELGKALNLKIVWAQDINTITYVTDLQSGRYDVECSGGWPTALSGRQVEYTTPFFYSPFYLYARVNDTRFDGNYEAVNDPSIKLAMIDGSTEDMLRQRRFPRSTMFGLMSGSDASAMFVSVASGKADATFTDYASFQEYDRNNPGVLRRVPGLPLRNSPFNASLAAGEFRLQQMLNVATRELLYDGVIDRILDKYETVPGTYLRVAPPYSLPKENN